MTQATILILYYSRKGSTAALARHAARGVESAGAIAKLRTVPSVSATSEATSPAVPDSGPPYATREDLEHCDGLLLGSPTRFGNMAAPLKYFLDQTSALWLSGALVDRPCGFFTSSTSPHGGQESTLLTMMVPLIHHGMIVVGVPYTENALFETQSGGSPYGATHLANTHNSALSKHEETIAKALGRRVAVIATRLSDAA